MNMDQKGSLKMIFKIIGTSDSDTHGVSLPIIFNVVQTILSTCRNTSNNVL